MADFLYDGSVDYNWNTLGNWWTGSGYSTPAAALPAAGDNVSINGFLMTYSGSAPSVNIFAVNAGGAVGPDFVFNAVYYPGHNSAFSGNIPTRGYYFNGTFAYGIDSNGTGWWAVAQGGYDLFFITGALTTLPSTGTGFDSTAGGFGYCILGVSTAGALDSSGNGIWQTLNYFGGVSAGVPGTDTRWLMWNGSVYGGNWDDPANWTIWSNAEWNGNAAIAAAVPTAVDNCQIPDYTMPVAHLSNAVCKNIKVEYNGNIGGFYYVSGAPVSVSGTATITGTNAIPMTGAGTANFTGSAKNIANITFSVINFRDSSSNSANPVGVSTFYGVCSVASFYDNATNAGGNYGIGLDIAANSAANSSGYYSGVVTGASLFYNNSINYGGCLGIATFYDNAKNMLGLNGGVVLSYNKGINGTGILGIF